MTTTPVLDALWAAQRAAVDRLQRTATPRSMPQSPQAQVAFLHRRLGGKTARLADLLGVHPETVRRYLRGQRRHPPAAFAARLADAVRAKFRPRLARTADDAMRTRGLRCNITATFSFASASAGTSDDGRERRLNEDLTPHDTRRLLAARDAGDENGALDIAGQGVAARYFGLHGTGMDVWVRDLVHITFEL
ncbi:helix-turn-helix domain-containing protein [Streptomyces sp. NPDC006733]|uniref:telomere-protecting terminal protein Tpg n=1 Tax=Streptomyces sp. NPDC006733 TaxID=3155460 RepID=UPI00340AFB94